MSELDFWAPDPRQQRIFIDALKSGRPLLSVGRAVGKTFCAAVAISELAKEKGGITLIDGATGTRYDVPAGTPWQEALPVRVKD